MQHTKHMYRFAARTCSVLASCLLLGAGLHAQTVDSTTTTTTTTTAPAAPATSAIDTSNQVVALPAFNVSDDAVHGYLASESITGTRIAARIQDLPFSVSVVTSSFLSDFAALDMNEQLAFVAGISPSEVTGQVQLRGFSAPTTMVDGFRRINLLAVNDIDRIEIIKGASASIYGAIQPGGVINYITRQPTTTPEQEVQVGGGTDDQYRASLYSSGPVGTSNKVFYSLDISDQFNKYSDQFASHHDAYVSGKVLFKPDANTNITIGVSHSEVYEHPFAQVLTVTEKQTMPWAANNITESQYYGMATNGLLNYNYQGPESYNHNRLTQVTLDFEHRFNEVWSFRLGANAYSNPYNDQLVGSGAYYPYGTGNVTVVNGAVQQPFAPEVKDQPQADWKPQRGGGVQMDNNFNFDTGPIKHQMLFTADYNELTQKTVTLVPTLGTTSQATDYYGLYSPYHAAGAPYYTPASTWSPALLGYGWNTTLYGQNPSLYNGVSTDNYTADADYGLFGSENASVFDDRLHLLAGGRWDYVRNQVKNYNFPSNGAVASSLLVEPTAYQAFDYNTSAYTYELGASFAVTNAVNVYVNKSSAFNPQPQISSITGLALPNNTSNGWEYGVKANLSNQFTLTLDRFLINEYNLAFSETDPVSGLKDTVLTGQQQSKGYEMSLNYQPNNALNFLADWGYTQAKTLNAYALTFLDGTTVRRVPRDNVGVAVHYAVLHGALHGLFFTADTRYFTKSLVNLGSGKSLVPGPASPTSGSTLSMYYVPSSNLTYTSGTDPKATGEIKITATPFNNVPLPGNGQLPFVNQAANALINYPVNANGTPLPLATPGVANIYAGEPQGVFVDDGRINNFNAPYCVVDVGTGYTWKGKEFTHTFQVNLKNLLNREYTYGSGAPGAPFQVVCTYTLRF